MPITLGILAQSRQAPAAAGSYDLLETYSVGSGGIASVTFSNLNTSYGSTYKHLQLRIAARLTSNQAGDGGFSRLRFNGDSSSSYRAHNLFGNGSTVTSSASGQSTEIGLNRLPDSGATANAFGAIVIDILDPFVTTKNTTTRQMAGYANNTPYIWFGSGAYFNTNAITSIFLEPGVGGNYAEFSRFSLYGVK